MLAPKCMIEGQELPNIKEDFQEAKRIEQYRVSKSALYFPEGLRWKYLPLDAVVQIDESFRVISAGHCVPVREKRPEIDLITQSGLFHVSLEKEESMKTMLEMLNG